jgi:phosphatidate cytidylyltransferase
MADTPPTPAISKSRTFVRRTTSTLILWSLVGSAFCSQRAWAHFALVAVLSLISTLEYFRMLKAANVKCFPRFGILISAAYSVAIGYYYLRSGRLASGGHLELPNEFDLIAIFIATTGAFTLQLRQPIRGLEALQSVAFNVLGFIYIPLLFHFAARMVYLVPGPGEVPGSILLMMCLTVTKFTDMGAYLVGTLIGRHKMIPQVSPGKTWEGFFGALIIAEAAACGFYYLLPGPTQLGVLGGWPHVIALGLILPLLAVIGDLAESVLKRALAAKDSGQMLPGIGGALDLIDSICFTAPALYFYVKWLMP